VQVCEHDTGASRESDLARLCEPALKGYPVKDDLYVMLGLTLLVGVVVAPLSILTSTMYQRAAPPSREVPLLDCSNRQCVAGSFALTPSSSQATAYDDPQAIVRLPPGIVLGLPPDRPECNTGCLPPQVLEDLREQEEQRQAEIAARIAAGILTPDNPLQWMSDLQNPEAVAFECAARSPREGQKVDYPGGALAGVGVLTTMPHVAWQPLVPDPGVEDWINWACSVSKPSKPRWMGGSFAGSPSNGGRVTAPSVIVPPEPLLQTINGQVLAAN
jgi:hypothetical protein